MPKQRKRYTAEFKAKVALEVVKAHRSLNEIASEYGSAHAMETAIAR